MIRGRPSQAVVGVTEFFLRPRTHGLKEEQRPPREDPTILEQVFSAELPPALLQRGPGCVVRQGEDLRFSKL